MGLPGAGKTHLANEIVKKLEQLDKTVAWYNADAVREKYNDWDFSVEGRIRQSLRMKELADQSAADYVICDFVAPLKVMRENFSADWTVWMDTIEQGRFADTNNLFEQPENFDFRITEFDAAKWGDHIARAIAYQIETPKFDWKKETAQMLGRYQPWHGGHRALFERLLHKVGQVCIMVRDCNGWQNGNPFDYAEVEYNIRRDLDPLYKGRYTVVRVPNITRIGYGRDVGYVIEKEEFAAEITEISATKIRKQMGLE